MVLIVEHGSQNLYGHLRRNLNEPSRGIFYGEVSKTVREHVWEMVCSETACEATLIYEYPNEQGYAVLSHNVTRRHPVYFDGVILYEMESNELALNDCFAKSDKTTLLDHLYETGLVAKCLLTEGRGKSIVKVIARELLTTEENAINFVSFLAAIHDIGKLHPLWQLAWMNEDDRVYEKYKRLNLIERDSTIYQDVPFRHEVYSAMLVKEWLIKRFNMRSRIAENIVLPIRYHHQGKNQKSRDDDGYQIHNKNVWDKLQNEVFNKIYEIFGFSPEIKVRNDAKLLYTIISIIIAADWISSGNNEFSKRSIFKNDEDYIKYTSNYIIEFFEKNDLKHNDIGEEISFSSLFGFSRETDTQKTVKEIVKEYNSSTSYLIIEDVCGSGKTEAAFIAAAELAKYKNKGGVYVGLPTAATSRAMYNRFESFLDRLSILPETGLAEFTSKSFLHKEDENEHLWSTPSRQKFLKSSAIGTVDQIMHGIQAYKYGALRWLGITDKVIIIDELHAYDFYMMDIINKLLEWCTWAEVPVIMLSATLPKIIKEGIYKNSNIANINNICKKEYPLITICSNFDDLVISEQPVKCERTRTIPFELIEYDDNKISFIAQRACNLVENGGNLCIIVNTVDEAINVYKKIENSFDGEIYLLHSRFTEAKKTSLTNTVVSLFGKNGKLKGLRPFKAIVISTQIIEQSMDVDFDYLITDIAPIDSLIQRMGRWHRHEDAGTIRENIQSDYSVKIVVPHIINEEYLSTNLLVYDLDGVIINTIDSLKKRDIIREPDDIRALIDEVYVMTIGMAAQKQRLLTYADATLIDELEYERLKKQTCDTRFSALKYVDLCLIDSGKWDETISAISNQETSYKTAIDLMKNNVISVLENKVRNVTKIDIECHDLLKETYFLRLEDGTYNEDDTSIILDDKTGLQLFHISCG